ncbi:MAG: hypothetical protein ACK5NT_06000 [Pyrinomonadaceae bacterium]
MSLNENDLKAVFELYAKHGWKPFRILLKSSEKVFGAFSGLDVRKFSLNAAWFYRASGDEKTAWELRLLECTPRALVQTLPNKIVESEREAYFDEMQLRLIEMTAIKH